MYSCLTLLNVSNARYSSYVNLGRLKLSILSVDVCMRSQGCKNVPVARPLLFNLPAFQPWPSHPPPPLPPRPHPPFPPPRPVRHNPLAHPPRPHPARAVCI